jgi:calcium-dependent protein kinase
MGVCSGRSKFGKIVAIPATIPSSILSDSIILDNVNNHYIFQKVLGSGHFGIVCEARKKGSRTKTTFAIKTLSKANLSEEIENIKRELEILRIVDHPNIIKMYEAYEDAKYIHVVTEL